MNPQGVVREKLPALGARVKALRKARGWSMERLARAMEVSRATIATIEQGQAGPRFDTIIKLARALEVSVSELFGEEAGAA